METQDIATARESAAALSVRARALINHEFRDLLEAGPKLKDSDAAAAVSNPIVIPTSACTVGGAGETLRGVVALVEVCTASEAAALRATLRALGASVRATWTPDVTHVIWRGGGGGTEVRRTALRLNATVVSPRWVVRCAAAARRVPESPHRAIRDSDPPSPRRMRRLLRWAEKENVPLDSCEESDSDNGPLRLRGSSDDETPLKRSRRQLNTQQVVNGDAPLRCPRRIIVNTARNKCAKSRRIPPFMVCTGVEAAVREEALTAAATLGGTVATRVSSRTTHVVCGTVAGSVSERPLRTLAVLEGAARGCRLVSVLWLRDSLAARRWLPPHHYSFEPLCVAHAGARALRAAGSRGGGDSPLLDLFRGMRVHVSERARAKHGAARLLRLCGATLATAGPVLLVTDCAAEAAAVAGVGAVSSRWVFDSVTAGRARSLKRYRL